MAPEPAAPDQVDSPEWRQLLLHGHRPMKLTRAAFRLMPGPPRCKVCSNPFGGFGGKLCALAGFKPSRKNPNLCARCCESLPEGGATVDVGVLFADIRGATTLGEHMAPLQFAGEMSRFYRQTTSALLKHGALIDKLTGDGVMALFIAGVAGQEYRQKTSLAAIELQDSLTRPAEGRPGLPVGIGAHVGEAYVGNVGVGAVVDFTALGDTINIAARLQALAGAGEVVLSGAAFQSLDAAAPPAESRDVNLRGRDEPMQIHVLRSAHAVAPPPAA